ncbi:MAG: Fic family protein [Magnetococcales bacterium]|nr:Fic family protein [Magnetococcales bacterium]
MERGPQGELIAVSTVGGEPVRSFVPAPLPPDPPIAWSPALREKFDQAYLAIGRLDGAARLLPESSLFIYVYVRKEAVLSSQIEGTQSSLADLLLYELDQAPGVPLDDVRDVSNYVKAFDLGLQQIKGGFPLSLRLLKEMHGALLSSGRGSHLPGGEFRRSQNWIGGTRPGNAAFVPPPAHRVLECMGQLELFLHDVPVATPPLLKAALAHVQFETIHPFLDGNGRLGRLLITLILCERGVLGEPLLYLSLYFKLHRQQYYDLLTAVRFSGDWEAWLDFFADAVVVTATQAVETIGRLDRLARQDQERIAGLGRTALSAGVVHHALRERPLTTAKWLAKRSGLTSATINKVLENLVDLGLVEEITGRRRNRIFRYRAYMDILNEGTEPLAR